MNAVVLTFEENAVAYLAAAALRAMAQAVIVLLWSLMQAVSCLLACWRPCALFLGLMACVSLCVVCPLLPVGLALTALFGWVSHPKGARS